MHVLKRSQRSKEKVKRDRVNARARAYLDKTDWYVTRSIETGKPIPAKIKTKRAKARELVQD